MNHKRPSLWRAGRGGVPDEGHQGERVQRYPVVRPGRVVVLVDRAFLRFLSQRLSVCLDLAHGERPEGVPGKGVLARGSDHEVAVGLGAGVGPVQVALRLERKIK